jgi:hypothetical protein
LGRLVPPASPGEAESAAPALRSSRSSTVALRCGSSSFAGPTVGYGLAIALGPTASDGGLAAGVIASAVSDSKRARVDAFCARWNARARHARG